MIIFVVAWLASQGPVDAPAASQGPVAAPASQEPVAAPAAPLTVAALLDEALSEMGELEYEAAHGTLLEILNAKDATTEQLVEAHRLSGEVCVILGRDVEARGHYLWLLRRDPSMVLPDDTPAKVATFFTLVREEVAAERERSAPPLEPVAPEPKAPSATPAPDPSRVDRLRSGLFTGISSGCANVTLIGGGGVTAGAIGMWIGAGCGACISGGATAAGAWASGAVVDTSLAVPMIAAASGTLLVGGASGLLVTALTTTEGDARGAGLVLGIGAGVGAGLLAGISAALLVPDPPEEAGQKRPATTKPGAAPP